MNIIKPTKPNVNGEPEKITVSLSIPIYFYLYGKQTKERYRQIAAEYLRLKAGVCFEHIALLGSLAAERDIDDLSGILDVLGKVGKGFLEAIENIERDSRSGQKSEVLDLSDSPIIDVDAPENLLPKFKPYQGGNQ